MAKIRLKAPHNIELAEAVASDLRYDIEKLPPHIREKTKVRYRFWSTRVTLIYDGRKVPQEIHDMLRHYWAYL